MAKTTRNEAWHEAYKAIFSKTGCLRLTVDQVSGYSGRTQARRLQALP